MDSSESSTPESGVPRRRLRSGVLTAGAVVAMVLAGLGVAGAQTGDSSTSSTEPAQSAPSAQAQADDEKRAGCRVGHPRQEGLAVAAATIGITVEELRQALQDGQSIAQVAQSKNVDPQKVIDAMVAAAQEDLPERITALVNCEGLGKHGPGHRKGHGHGRGPGPGPGIKAGLDVAAEAIGISEADLRAALRDGQSIAQVAQSKNVDPQKVIDAMVAEAKEKLAERVAAGDMTQAEADEKAANLAERITNMVNREGGLRHGPGPRGDDRPAADAPAEPTAATA